MIMNTYMCISNIGINNFYCLNFLVMNDHKRLMRTKLATIQRY
jgi:hypothetical protein